MLGERRANVIPPSLDLKMGAEGEPPIQYLNEGEKGKNQLNINSTTTTTTTATPTTTTRVKQSPRARTIKPKKESISRSVYNMSFFVVVVVVHFT
jgi:hypothetical protein